MDAAKQQAIRILRSWHRIEFFQPYNLPSQSLAGERLIKPTHDEINSYKNQILPWLDDNARHQLNIPSSSFGNAASKTASTKRIHFILYLGVFDKSELNTITERCFGAETDEQKALEFEQRSELEGDTCFAKLPLDQWGTPDFEKMSVSTLPWALGHLVNDDIDKLTMASFDQSAELLTQALARIALKLPPHPRNPEAKTLSAGALNALTEELHKWARFTPSSRFAFALDWYEVKPSKAEKALTDKSHELPNPNKDKTSTSDTDEEATADQRMADEKTRPILNSFYIEDIENVVNSIANDSCNQAMLDYLRIRQLKQPDLYTQAGLKLIVDKLAPELLPAGRWPAEPKHNMTLMQQFAINTVFDELKDGGLLSVNGPPGTGKTTLLRDVIAQNIVGRAKVLASLPHPSDGLTDMGFPIAALTGFEMVVASSNNLAVENISKELPLMASIAKEFANLDHYKPIANQLNAVKTKKGYQPLAKDEQCWGLISAVLGRQKNRANFVDSFFFDYPNKQGSKAEAQRPDELNFLNIYRWNSLHQAPNFKKAQLKFNSLNEQFEQQVDELKQLAELKAWLADNNRESPLAQQSTIISEAQANEAVLQQTIDEICQEIELLEETVEVETLKFADIESQRTLTDYEHQLSTARQRLIAVKQQLTAQKRLRIDTNKQIKACQQTISTAQLQFNQINQQYNAKAQTYRQLSQQHQDKAQPDLTLAITDEQLQRHAFWQDESFNRLRSHIFIAALELQQAWVCEAFRNKNFHNNVYEIKDVLKHTEVTHPQALWQTLFMLVPVVSTTFASLGRMFSNIKSAELGWLMIDEAGQAVPQAAVGGIWRAKRVLVVGDPQQIEPVFTTPPRLVELLSQSTLDNDSVDWDPQHWSVQQIADRANAYGCELNVMEKPQWLGIPLWVHRRCIEPMFSIANTIAYDGRMIHGLPAEQISAQPHQILGVNRWQTSQGQCTIRQYKNELGDDTLTLLLQLAQHNHPLSEIYIISPFKAVKQQLIRAIDQQKSQLCRALGLTLKQYKQWRNSHIGTVHTFQGKENVTVILVLGCDPQQSGGAAWAASKPNLLNVALTRAKQHIFVVGDPDVWQHRSYFSLLARALG